MRKSRNTVAVSRAACLLGLTCISVIADSSSALGWEWVSGPPRTEARPWGLARDRQPSGKRAIRIEVGAGYCSGETRPFIHHVATTRTPGRFVARVYVQWPEPQEVSGAVEPDEPSPGCADLVATLSRTLRLSQDRQDVKLFDGYYSPPKRVAPQIRTRSARPDA